LRRLWTEGTGDEHWYKKIRGDLIIDSLLRRCSSVRAQQRRSPPPAWLHTLSCSC
jgi:hypothetical protein